MPGRAPRVAAGVLLLSLAVACTSPSAPGAVDLGSVLPTAPVLPTTARPQADGRCSAGQLVGLYAGGVVPYTGEHSAWINVWNVSSSGCTVEGSPTVGALSGTTTLPFRVQHDGPYIDERAGGAGAGRRTLLRPREAAHFLVAKYRCDSGEVATVSRISVALAGQQGRIMVDLPAGYDGPGLAYCRAYGGAPDVDDPGNRLQVGPLMTGPVTGT